MKDNHSDIELMTEHEVAELLKVSVSLLRRQRTTRSGIPFVKMGTGQKSPVRYRHSDIVAYLNKNLRVPTLGRR